VRQVADQLLVELGLLQQALLALLAGLLLYRQEFNDDLFRPVCRGNHHMHRQALGMVQTAQCGLVAQHCKLVTAQALQSIAQRHRVDKVFVQPMPQQAPARQTQRVFERSIDRHHAALRVEHGDRCGQQVKRQKTLGSSHGCADAGERRSSSRCRLSMSRWARSTAALSCASSDLPCALR